MTVIQTTASPASMRVDIDRLDQCSRIQTDDLLTVEEPLAIRLAFHVEGKIDQRNLSITMRTPGCDDELAAGFLFGEGIVSHASDIIRISHCGPAAGDSKLRNVVRVQLADHVDVDWQQFERHSYTSSSCGICGKTSLAAVGVKPSTSPPIDFQIDAQLLYLLPQKLRLAQSVFEDTGGLHAAALFDNEGKLLTIREDVGRHNALDKLVGAELLAGRLPLSEPRILLLSGRASFELLQKAAAAGITIVAAIGAPSTMAVELARQANITLIGFLRNGRCNIYCGQQRITEARSSSENSSSRSTS